MKNNLFSQIFVQCGAGTFYYFDSVAFGVNLHVTKWDNK